MPQWSKMRALAQGRAEIVIFNEIGATEDGSGISAARFDAELKALGDVKEITLRINSPGGDVFEGLAIYNTLKAHPATIIAQIDGMAASAASLIAMAADRIVMPSNAMFLIHEPRFPAVFDGTSASLTSAAADLKVMTDAFVAAYCARTKLSPEDVAALMAEDRVMGATEAKSLGFADEITDAVKMVASYSLKKLPKKARALVAAALSQGKTMPKRPTARRARADDSDTPSLNDLQDQMGDLCDQVATLADTVADMQGGDADGDDLLDPDASDDDSQSGADTDDPNARASADGEDGEGDEDAPPPSGRARARGKAPARAGRKAPRTFKTGQEQALAYARQVTETCALAGFADRAAAYIRDRKPMTEIRSDLMKARSSGKQDQVSGHHRYGGSRGNTAAADTEAAKGWDSAVAKTNKARSGVNGRGSKGAVR